jgi:seryl-tRNA synthetase
MASDELRIILEDVKEKFDTVIEGYNFLSEKIDRLGKQNEAEHQELRNEVVEVKKDIRELRQDLNEHRSNTEFHGGRKRKKAS